MRSTTLEKPSTVAPSWLLISAKDQVVGRLATKIARILMGKHKPSYTPHVDTGDFVVVTDVEKIAFTGNKMEDKLYHHHTGYLSGLRERTAAEIMAKDPSEVLLLAVKRMMPKTKLGRKMLKKLKIYAGSTHPHGAQDPQAVDLQKI